MMDIPQAMKINRSKEAITPTDIPIDLAAVDLLIASDIAGTSGSIQ